MKKILIGFFIYYGLGFILMNAFAVSRFLQSANIINIGPKIIIQNMSNPTFWGLTLIWPLYLGYFLYSFAAGNFGD